ncbi:hypothetical protein [Pseudonocardia sp.]|uniref:hypothetical protein n=1 Tax=Pseudonocardia sp. TaxID=60912 RepID=UPI002629AAA3|nr:hypothetical protein [Pseudonocardia sp.]
MAGDDDLERRVRKLAVEHAETRWLALRLDDDVKEVREELRAIRGTLAEHTARFDSVEGTLAEHGARFDSVEGTLAEHGARFDSVGDQLRSLTQLVGQVLDRLPDGSTPPDDGG